MLRQHSTFHTKVISIDLSVDNISLFLFVFYFSTKTFGATISYYLVTNYSCSKPAWCTENLLCFYTFVLFEVTLVRMKRPQGHSLIRHVGIIEKY